MTERKLPPFSPEKWGEIEIWTITGRKIQRIHKLLCDIEDKGCPQMKKPVAEIRRLLQG